MQSGAEQARMELLSAAERAADGAVLQRRGVQPELLRVRNGVEARIGVGRRRACPEERR